MELGGVALGGARRVAVDEQHQPHVGARVLPLVARGGLGLGLGLELGFGFGFGLGSGFGLGLGFGFGFG